MNKKEYIKMMFLLDYISFVIGFIFVSYIIKSSVISSEYWSITFVRSYYYSTYFIFKYIPFSITELLVVGLIILGIYLLVLIIKNIKRKEHFLLTKNISKFLLTYLSVFMVYNITAGVEYNRGVVDIPQYKEKVNIDDILLINDYFIEDFNLCASKLEFTNEGDVINPYSIRELNDIINDEYKKLNSPYFSKTTTYAKPMLSSYLYRELNITGVFFAPISEANINHKMSTAEFPFVFAHEIAHSKGVMREEDAQLVAMYITLNSSDYFLRYSAYMWTYSYLLNLTRYLDDTNAYRDEYLKLDINIRKNYQYLYDYWNQFDFLSKLGNWINDLYLKFQGQKEGTDSYTKPGNDDSEVVGPPEHQEIIIHLSTYQSLYFYNYYLNH